MSEYAARFIGRPYIFGGNTPTPGWDCSALIGEVLRAFGYLGKVDWQAQRIFDFLRANGWVQVSGLVIPDSAILFFGADVDSIEHCAIAYGDGQMVEAAGGDSKCLSEQEAAKQIAFTRLRPITWRKDFKAALIPPKGKK